MIELGMNLARQAAARAQRDMAASLPDIPMPGSAAAALEMVEHRARLRTPNYALVFARLTRAVRQTLVLQAHVAAGHPPPGAAPSPTRDKTLRATPAAPKPHRDSSTLRSDASERPDYLLPFDVNGSVPVEALLATIREQLTLAALHPDEDQPRSHSEPPRANARRTTAPPPGAWRPSTRSSEILAAHEPDD